MSQGVINIPEKKKKWNYVDAKKKIEEDRKRQNEEVKHSYRIKEKNKNA